MATLQIELEDMAGASWWQGLVATLTAQSGSAYLRFVGRVDGRRQYRGALLIDSSDGSLGATAPRASSEGGQHR